MGCGSSSPKAKKAPEETKEPKTYTFGRDPAMEARRHEFMVQEKSGETIVREPGKIAGQQFLIDNCRDCNIYLFDNNAAISIDDCVNCRILIGPCASSCFIRDCKDCTIIGAVQQFRTRDCRNIRMLLFSHTAPIIETSRGMVFGCYRFNYTALAGQFAAAGISLWNNKWADVFDFTSGDGHYKLMAPGEEDAAMLAIPDEIAAASEVKEGNVVPYTLSTHRRAPKGERCFVLFGPGHNTAAVGLVQAATAIPTVGLIRTREFALNKVQAKHLWKMCGRKGPPAAPASCIGLEFKGAGAGNVVRGVVSSLSVPDKEWLSPEDEDTTAQAISYFFVETEENAGHRLG